jgi:cytochrome c-type biogenesis protein CcsB
MQTSIVYIQIAFFVYLLSFLLYAYGVVFARGTRVLPYASAILPIGLISQLYFLIARTYEYWQQYRGFVLPATNLFEAINFLAFLVILAYFVLELVTKIRIFGAFVLALPLVGLFYIIKYLNSEAGMRELPPALKSYWLPIHVSAMFISYALFTVAAAIALYYILKVKWGIGLKAIDSKFSPERIDRINYLITSIGYPFLTAGIFLGAVWANEAWGRYWGWDPKETWAAISWFLYTAYMHARLALGWKGFKAMVFNFIAYDGIIITFLGVNLLSGTLGAESIHAYATGSGSLWALILMFALLIIPPLVAFAPGSKHLSGQTPEGEALAKTAAEKQA